MARSTHFFKLAGMMPLLSVSAAHLFAGTPGPSTLTTRLALCLVASVPEAQATAQASGLTTPNHSQLSPGVTRTVQEIMDEERMFVLPRWKEENKLKRDHSIPALRDRPANPMSPSTPVLPLASLEEFNARTAFLAFAPLVPQLSAQTVGINFTGASYVADAFNFTPPDTQGAVGPTQFLMVINGRIRSFDKATGIRNTPPNGLDSSLDTFWTSVRAGAGTGDPRVRYDRVAKRWVVIAFNTSATNNLILVAVSDAASAGVISATTTWTYYALNRGAGIFADYPTLAVDNNAAYIGVNNFTGAGAYVDSGLWVVNKSTLYGGSAYSNYFTISSSNFYTPHGADNFDASATEGYVIGGNAAWGAISFLRVNTPGAGSPSAPTLSAIQNIAVPQYRNPLAVQNLGGDVAQPLDALDDRFYAATVRNGRLWTAHNVGINNAGTETGTIDRTGSRWYEFTTLSTTPTIVQSGLLFVPTAGADNTVTNYWMPSIMLTGQGHAGMGFSSSGRNAHANAGFAGRLTGDTLGTLQPPLLITASGSGYDLSWEGGSRHRWGDYSYTSLDPNDDMTLWTIQEFAQSTSDYAVQVARLLAPAPTAPTLAAPASVAVGQASVSVVLTGATGLFDPGAGFVSRLQAAVPGVTVNSVTYTNPTQVTLDLDTVGATAGSKNVTLTNPDGQGVVAAGLFSVGAPSAILAAAGVAITAESCPPANNFPDPNEALTVDLTVTNTGGSATSSSLVGTLQAIGGVSSPSAAQNYGVIAPGASVTRSFSFTASGACGTIIPSLQLQDGAINDGTVTYAFTTPAGASQTFSNLANITINDAAAGAPYPSTINVAGINPAYTRATLTLNNMSHTIPNDVDIIVVGPGGQKAYVMSDVGGGTPIVGANLTFDDLAAASLPSPIVSGTWKPTNTVTPDPFPAPAPAGPYDLTFAALGGLGAGANGTWSLYVVDDLSGDTGAIAGGWSLTFYSPFTCNTGCAFADLSLTNNATSGAVTTPGGTITYTFTGTNVGPDPATDVVITTAMPTGTTFNSASAAGATLLTTPAVGANGTITATWSGATAAAASRALNLSVNAPVGALQGAIISDTATISSSTPDPTPGNNAATSNVTVQTAADLSITNTITSGSQAIPGGNVTYLFTGSNAGPQAATDLVITTTVPTGTTFNSVTAAGAVIVKPAVGGTGPVSATWLGATAAGGTRVVNLSVKVPAAALPGTNISDTVTILSTLSDPNPANNSATSNVVVAYDKFFLDDSGRTRMWLNSTNGYWKLEVLLGPDAGLYLGHVTPTTNNGALVLPSVPPPTQSVWGFYDPATKRASFTLRTATGRTAYLFDTNTTGQLP